MPIYEYRCANGHDFDCYATVERRQEGGVCLKCGAEAHKVILHAPRVFGDYEGYVSPTTGKWIEGKSARREDLRSSGCRPYEAGEREAAERRRAADERALDAVADQCVERTLWDMTNG